MLRTWWARRQAAKAERQYDAGFHWVAETLYRKEMSAQQIRDRCELPFEGPNPFDKGAIAAIDIFDRLVAALEKRT